MFLGPEDVSGKLVSKVTISSTASVFADFQTLNNLPRTRLVPRGLFSKFWDFKLCNKSFVCLNFLHLKF